MTKAENEPGRTDVMSAEEIEVNTELQMLQERLTDVTTGWDLSDYFAWGGHATTRDCWETVCECVHRVKLKHVTSSLQNWLITSQINFLDIILSFHMFPLIKPSTKTYVEASLQLDDKAQIIQQQFYDPSCVN